MGSDTFFVYAIDDANDSGTVAAIRVSVYSPNQIKIEKPQKDTKFEGQGRVDMMHSKRVIFYDIAGKVLNKALLCEQNAPSELQTPFPASQIILFQVFENTKSGSGSFVVLP